jgi:predicted kinase
MIAKELARQLDAVYLRIDSIEQAIRDSGVIEKDLYDAGYRVGYAVAEDNLRVGRKVVADSVNPLAVTREAWLAVAHRAQVTALEIEVKCSDPEEDRRRVISRRNRRSWTQTANVGRGAVSGLRVVGAAPGYRHPRPECVERCVQIIRDWLGRGQ